MNDLLEIEILVRKGARRLNSFFYVGVVVGVIMGPAVLILATVPSVREAVIAAEAGYNEMLIFGTGMTLLLGIASAEQWFKVRNDNKLLAALGENPHHIANVHKEKTNETFIHVHFKLSDGTRTKVWLQEPDADRLFALLNTVAMVFCPYCVTPIAEETVSCPRCGQDTRNDAPFEMTFTEYRAEEHKECRHCGASLAKLAVRCPECTEKQ
jgi:ribosomal protein L40E